ncbi:MAG: hypothetical protein EOQ28_04190 [Mesorhizobium sp.]|uniref:hypothetical protein n=1 Tax=Mesorhizobium sp. TaxID=1871066 RepID=UPI000FE9FB88|nr:hypothetical protein [Mesorhizobium sp.]RWA76890.1 MAG: hypothetical protein EOQ28_04190 [Mesorhizobium sp.]
MTVRLDSLRVGAEFNASAYTTGAAQKVAADASMVASNQRLAQSATMVESKISASGDVLTRLSRRYVDGFASTEKMTSALNSLASGVERGKISMQQAEPILDGIIRKFNQVAEASQFAQRGQTGFAAAVAQANARFTGAPQPVPASPRPRLSSGQLQGLGYQLNDVITMAALGAPASQIAFSQGGQILQNLQAGEGGISGSLSAIKTGATDATKSAMALLGTTGMIVTGFGLAAAAVGAFYFATRDHIKSADDVLKDHAKNIQALKDAYGDAADAAIAYGKAAANEGRPGIAIPTAMTELELRLSLADEARTSAKSLIANDNGLIGGSQMGPTVTSQFKAFAGEVDAYRSSIAKGAPDVLAFRRAVTEKWDLNRNDEELTKEAAALLKLTDAAAKVALALPGAKAALDALNNGRYPGLADALARQDYEDANAASLYRLQQQQDATLAGIGARSPEERRQAAMAAERAKAGNDSAEVSDFKASSAGAIAYAQAVHQITEANEQRKRSLDQAIASAQLELGLTGQTTAPSERMFRSQPRAARANRKERR